MTNEDIKNLTEEQELKRLKEYANKLKINSPALNDQEPIGNINRSTNND